MSDAPPGISRRRKALRADADPAARFLEERAIALRLGRSVTALEPEGRIIPEGGARLRHLIGRPAVLRLRCQGGDLAGVHDPQPRGVDGLSRAEGDAQVVVIGGGYRPRGRCGMTRLGAGRPARSGGPKGRGSAERLRSTGRASRRGVDVRTGIAVEGIGGAGRQGSGGAFAGGEILPADLVIVGIGIGAAVVRDRAGAAGSADAPSDAHCRTSLADVLLSATAPLMRTPCGRCADPLELVQNAHDQATVAARAIIGQANPMLPSWFWSNQYDLKLQTVGLSRGHDDLVVRGDPAARSFSIVYLRRGRVIALDCVNAVKDYVQGRKLILEGVLVDKARLADTGLALKDLVWPSAPVPTEDYW